MQLSFIIRETPQPLVMLTVFSRFRPNPKTQYKANSTLGDNLKTNKKAKNCQSNVHRIRI